jgi:nitrite reductase/ring-hydroxylating ferredoxin subunit
MKKYALIFLIIPFFLSCSDSGLNNSNPFIPNYTFSVDVNMNLPAYSNLKFVSNAVYISGIGAKGIYVFCTAPDNYNAFDAACPNQALNSCSNMTLKGINIVCACDSKEYSLFTGQAQGGAQYPLKQYRVQVNGNVLRVYN